MCLEEELDNINDTEKDSEAANVCTLCSLSFVEPSEFHFHMEKNHSTNQQDSSTTINPEIKKQHLYECPECGKSYGVIGHYLNHQRSHRQAAKSVFHDLEHLKKKSFQCDSCGRNYSRASALDAHRRCHEEKLVKPRNRDLGDPCVAEESVVESKPSENQTDDNQTDDIPDKLFKCSCGKAFTALMRLKTHQRFSRNSQCSPEGMIEKPKKSGGEFYCSECKKAFSGHLGLFNHQRWHANHSNDSAKRFTCEECGKVFTTLTFYHKHQRSVHSNETPAKSFLHQVCQLQKKAFECKDCGLKFSRASALHSHELHHTDVFKETEKEAQRDASFPPQQKNVESETKDTKWEKVQSESLLPTTVAEHLHANESDEDVEHYEPGDFVVQVISASESEDETVQDPNPDLELLCESDQEVRDDEVVISPSNVVTDPGMDLKIVQIDYEEADAQCAPIAKETNNKMTEERFDCPDCYHWFSSAASLRVHRMWHAVRKRRQQTQGQSVTVYTHDTWGDEASSYAAHCSDMQLHVNTTNDLYPAKEFGKKRLACSECGKCFSHLSALVSHQLHHPKSKEFQCPDCMVSYSHAAALFKHMKNCSTQKRENISFTKKEYNPKKTLLGPKIYHCEQCGKGFWSLGAYSHHKQSQTLCADFRLRKGLPASTHSVNGHPRSSVKVACPVCGKKFRHKGIMALHMRKHENGNHKCELCNRSFRLFSSLLRHQAVHNNQQQLLPPPIKSFQYQVEQLKKNTYSCPDCEKLFSRAKALQFHMKSHGYETGYSPSSPRSNIALEDLQCAACLAHFNSKASLRAHQKHCSKKDGQSDCKTEPIENTTPALHGESVHVCTQERPLHITINPEINEKDSKDLKMESQTYVGSLENSSTIDLEYKCQKCDRSFSVDEALNFHERIHAKSDKSVEKETLFKKPNPPQSKIGPEPDWKQHVESKNTLSVLQNSQNLEISSLECNSMFTQNEQNKILEAADDHGSGVTVVDQVRDWDVGFSGSESMPTTLKSKVHQCPLCSMSFAKPRGLRAHKWQAHSKKTKGKNKATFCAKESVVSSIEVRESEEPHAVNEKITTGKNSSGGSEKKIRLDSKPMKSVAYLDYEQQYSSADALSDHKTVFLELKQESKHDIEISETRAQAFLPLSHPVGHTVRCFFKCDKCGKAFQSEEQLGSHKAKARTRPYCCALCCQGFWTENQLKQHFVWHDEVRGRLPHEVRCRLGAAMNSKPLKPSTPTANNQGKSFPSSSLNQSALNQESQSQSSHKCQHCGKSFISPKALQIHESHFCNSEVYHCSICPRTFSEIQKLISHHQECFANFKGAE